MRGNYEELKRCQKKKQKDELILKISIWEKDVLKKN